MGEFVVLMLALIGVIGIIDVTFYGGQIGVVLGRKVAAFVWRLRRVFGR